MLMATISLGFATLALFWILWVARLSIGTILPIELTRLPTMLNLDRAFWTMKLLRSPRELLSPQLFLSLQP